MSTTKSEPRTIRAPRDLEEIFLQKANENTVRDVETCGLLCGREEHGILLLSHLLLPPQRGTANTVEMLDDTEVGLYVFNNGLQVFGWIHTHPTQSAFLSSVDIHTQHTLSPTSRSCGSRMCTIVWDFQVATFDPSRHDHRRTLHYEGVPSARNKTPPLSLSPEHHLPECDNPAH